MFLLAVLLIAILLIVSTLAVMASAEFGFWLPPFVFVAVIVLDIIALGWVRTWA